MTDFRVFVTGSRTWDDVRTVGAALDAAAVDAEMLDADAMIMVHGGAEGADRIAHLWCMLHPATPSGIHVIEEIHRPDWDGPARRGAGFARNKRMAERQINLCLAFIRDGSPGATHALSCAEKAGVPVRVWRV